MKNDPRICERNLYNCVRRLKKIQDFHGIWTRDLAITVRCFNQLSNEATDVFAPEHINEHIIDQLPTSVASQLTWLEHPPVS